MKYFVFLRKERRNQISEKACHFVARGYDVEIRSKVIGNVVSIRITRDAHKMTAQILYIQNIKKVNTGNETKTIKKAAM